MANLFLIDDDPDIRNHLINIIESLDIKVISFASANEFLSAYNSDYRGCILSDIVMPDMDGLEFQQELIAREITLPLILMSSHGSIAMVKSVFKKGAIDFLEKPVDIKELLDAIKYGLSIVDKNKKNSEAHKQIVEKIKRLTHRENEILRFLVTGKENHEVASLLNISVRTVETHRNHVLKKMGYSSLQKMLTHSSVISEFT